MFAYENDSYLGIGCTLNLRKRLVDDPGQREIRPRLKEAQRTSKNLIRQLDHRDRERRDYRLLSFFDLSRRIFDTVASALQFPGKRRFSFRFPGQPIMSA